MLTEIFGLEWFKVHDEAEQLEHAVSADFERKLIEKALDEAKGNKSRAAKTLGLSRAQLYWRLEKYNLR